MKISRFFSAWFWFPIHTAHWRMWRKTVAQLSATRCRFIDLRRSLECEGSPESMRIARDIRMILDSKY